MKLREALTILSRAYTDPDEVVGFIVHSYPNWVSDQGQMIDAWEAVRRELGQSTSPRGSQPEPDALSSDL